MAQPHVALTPAEPFQCLHERRQQQLGVIARTLEIARANPHGAERTHFTIFPEFSIPGLAGVAAIDAALQSAEWPASTVVIGGVDGLNRTDYLALIEQPNTFVHAANRAHNVVVDQWVNCAVIWVKGASNLVERWIQPKIYPSRPENNAQFQRMFRGGCVYLFKGLYQTGGDAYRFSCLVCFDWIATVGALKPWQWLLSSMHNEGSPLMASLPLTWMFIIQNNDQPNHPTFLGELVDFYNPNQYPSADRQRTCIVFANNAGRANLGRIDRYGCTSLVLPQTATFTATDCYVTHSNGGLRFRGNNMVHPHRDVFFREGGPCIHSFIQVNPISIVPGAAGQTVPIEEPFVFPIDPAITDLRTPCAPVPGAVKWWNDTLDSIDCLSVVLQPSPTLSPDIAATHLLNEQELRTKDAAAAASAVELSDPTFVRELPGPPPRRVPKHADEWDASETDALTHVVNTLDIFRVGFPNTTSNTTGAHGTATIRDKQVEILAVRGLTHEQNQKHADKHVPLLRRQLVIVSRDNLNSRISRRDGTIFRVKPMGAKVKFNDPSYNRIYLGFQELLTEFIDANNPAELEGGICARLE